MANQYEYVPRLWLDQIIELDENNNTVYEKDKEGNLVYWKDQHGNYVLDPITMKPIPKPKFLQEGTKHKAKYENHQEQGIAMAHQRLNGHDNRILHLEINSETEGKAPGNAGSFSDSFEGEPTRIKRETASAVITTPVAAGTTVLPVDSVTGFVAFTQVTVYDGTNSEDVLITAVGTNTITVQALTKAYVKGAVIARSTARIVDGQMVNGTWGTYSVEVV